MQSFTALQKNMYFLPLDNAQTTCYRFYITLYVIRCCAIYGQPCIVHTNRLLLLLILSSSQAWLIEEDKCPKPNQLVSSGGFRGGGMGGMHPPPPA